MLRKAVNSDIERLLGPLRLRETTGSDDGKAQAFPQPETQTFRPRRTLFHCRLNRCRLLEFRLKDLALGFPAQTLPLSINPTAEAIFKASAKIFSIKIFYSS
jgi:hypothetical protein